MKKRNPFVMIGVIVLYYVVTARMVSTGELALWDSFRIGGFAALNVGPVVGALSTLASRRPLAICLAWIATLLGSSILGTMLF